jgi:hypothetical protein
MFPPSDPNPPEESILHLVDCPIMSIFWRKCLTFTHTVLGTHPIHPHAHRNDYHKAIIFGLSPTTTPTLLNTQTRALLRHAWGVVYRHFTQVDTDLPTFNPHVAFLHTLLSFRAATLRLAITTAQDRHKIRYSTLPISDPTKADEALTNLLAPRDPNTDPLSHPLSLPFQTALTQAEAEAY